MGTADGLDEEDMTGGLSVDCTAGKQVSLECDKRSCGRSAHPLSPLTLVLDVDGGAVGNSPLSWMSTEAPLESSSSVQGMLPMPAVKCSAARPFSSRVLARTVRPVDRSFSSCSLFPASGRGEGALTGGGALGVTLGPWTHEPWLGAIRGEESAELRYSPFRHTDHHLDSNSRRRSFERLAAGSQVGCRSGQRCSCAAVGPCPPGMLCRGAFASHFAPVRPHNQVFGLRPQLCADLHTLLVRQSFPGELLVHLALGLLVDDHADPVQLFHVHVSSRERLVEP